MRNLFVVLFVSIFLAGCPSIPKPDWNPGDTKPDKEGKRPECPLPAQWVWVEIEGKKDWLCRAVPAYYGYGYYAPSVYYGPTFYYGPTWYGPRCFGWPHCR